MENNIFERGAIIFSWSNLDGLVARFQPRNVTCCIVVAYCAGDDQLVMPGFNVFHFPSNKFLNRFSREVDHDNLPTIAL